MEQAILYRNGNLGMKTMCLILAMIIGCGMAWKKRKLKIKRGQNFNVITFSQSFLILLLLYLNNVLLDFLLPALADKELLFNMEMFRVIFIENILFKFVLPILMILQSKATLPSLWIDKDCNRKQIFFMTKQNILPRTHSHSHSHIKQTARAEPQIARSKHCTLGAEQKKDRTEPIPVPFITVVVVH